ncbi:hypothetical protein EZV62_018666 [Acer yangbiense]|uniref:Protein kinase domain-containing protein n=1 Tax=Acer yangbiense TaxID=1000413 RepID=A0A5C7HK08_9ROSI|nr:hypothetical protein EZV62_018666 [Acer yangbiense]
MVMAVPKTLHFALLIITVHFLLLEASLNNPDLQPLLDFKASTDKADTLTTWNTTSDLCSWMGVSCLQNRVSRLVLENLQLSSSFESLTQLTQLRVLSLKNNQFSGSCPDTYPNSRALKFCFCRTTSSPASFRRPCRSFSGSTGSICRSTTSPVRFRRQSKFDSSLTLRLEENQFSGQVSGLNLPNLQDLNVSGNHLSGQIPESISGFPQSAFAQNQALCGSPNAAMQDHRDRPDETRNRRSHSLAAEPWNKPQQASFRKNELSRSHRHYTRRFHSPRRHLPPPLLLLLEKLRERQAKVEASGRRENRVLLQPDLLRASAEMLGKGFGTAYKAVLDDGSCVAVKRLKDANVGGRGEKLLVSDYMPNGSLFWLLHGNRGPGRTPLDWTTRLKIAAGAARGITFIHNTCKSLKLNHGNIKSTNILLDKTGTARVSDFGLLIFCPPNTPSRSNGYRAPELSSSDGRKQSQKSDVYSFGVLLLELLTGKCPSMIDGGGPGMGYGGGAVDLPRWVQSVVREEWTAEVFDLELMRYKDIEEEMVGLLQVAMACTSASPDQRPSMGHVVKMIEEIRGVEMSPCHETLDSVTDSPCLSEDTCGGVSQ